MSAALVTQHGRTLHYDDLSAEDIGRVIAGGYAFIVGGHELGSDLEVFVSTRHIVEWWDKP